MSPSQETNTCSKSIHKKPNYVLDMVKVSNKEKGRTSIGFSIVNSEHFYW